MTIQFKEEVIYEGKKYTSIMEFHLIPYQELKMRTVEGNENIKPITFAQAMRASDKPFIRYVNDYSGISVQVGFDDIIREHEGIDLETVYLRIQTRLIPT